MNKETLRALLGMKLNNEIHAFRDEELGLEREDILGDCFKINMYIIIYEVLIENMNKMRKNVMKDLLDQQENIIDRIYEAWVEANGDDYERIKCFVEKEVAA